MEVLEIRGRMSRGSKTMDGLFMIFVSCRRRLMQSQGMAMPIQSDSVGCARLWLTSPIFIKDLS